MVATVPICSNLLEQCMKRGDSWASIVQDLVAAEAVYHTRIIYAEQGARQNTNTYVQGFKVEITACCFGFFTL